MAPVLVNWPVMKAVRMAGFTFRGGTEYGGHIVIAFDIGLLREIQITAIGLAFPREGGFQIFKRFAAGKRHW